MLDTVTVVIRSVGERTEPICKNLVLAQGVPEEAVFVINETPFSTALRIGLEIGVSQNRTWTYCIDADVLLRRGSILRILQAAVKEPQNVFEIQGFVLDKFVGGARMAGNHLYRTSLLPKALSILRNASTQLRPEASLIRSMEICGHPWRPVHLLIGLHDFEQSHEDIFRKCFVHAHKHLSHHSLFLSYWRASSITDPDFLVALDGFFSGLVYDDTITIDKNMPSISLAYNRSSTISLRQTPKLAHWDLDSVESTIVTWTEPFEYWQVYPAGHLTTNGKHLSLLYNIFRVNRQKSSVYYSLLLAVNWLLQSAFRKLKSGNA